MIAVTIFSITITLISASIIQIGKYYQQGNTKTRLNSLAREIQTNISQDYQFSGGDPITQTVPSGSYSGYTALCIGTTRYIYKLDTTEALLIDKISSTGQCASVVSSARKPLPKGAVVNKLEFNGSSITGVRNLQIRFVVGDKDLFVDDDYSNNCKSEAGREFCAVISLRSSVARKVSL
jgi:hypothetical protein